MPLQSMTGFARATGDAGNSAAAWEVRSVNGKSLEMRLRLPAGFERIEPAARQLVQKRFSRGNLQATLTLSGAALMAPPPVVNEAFLVDLAGLAQRLAERYGLRPASADGLLALPGVLQPAAAAPDEKERPAIDRAVLALLGSTLDGLEAARQEEGAAISGLLAAQLDRIDALRAQAEADPSREVGAIRARLADQLALLRDAGPGLDEGRLHAEAALLATRADIREELDRLVAHVAAARALLAQGGPVGRKLDFLAQEFNRESNTLCAKSNAGTVTAIGLELKAVVDQFREQVQNLE